MINSGDTPFWSETLNMVDDCWQIWVITKMKNLLNVTLSLMVTGEPGRPFPPYAHHYTCLPPAKLYLQCDQLHTHYHHRRVQRRLVNYIHTCEYCAAKASRSSFYLNNPQQFDIGQILYMCHVKGWLCVLLSQYPMDLDEVSLKQLWCLSVTVWDHVKSDWCADCTGQVWTLWPGYMNRGRSGQHCLNHPISSTNISKCSAVKCCGCGVSLQATLYLCEVPCFWVCGTIH